MYFIAINDYRGSTDDGFANTWRVYRCRSRKEQLDLLERGLPVRDQQYLHDDGTRSDYYSTKGIRLATPAEIRQAKRDLARYGEDGCRWAKQEVTA